MRYPLWKPLLIVVVLVGCALLMIPPEQRLKPGLDLAGGTTLVYDVRVPEDADSERVIGDLIAVLSDRVDPQGLRNLVWRQSAGNRIEIQMALASPEAKRRREAYQEARETLLASNLSAGELQQALQADQQAEALRAIAAGNEALGSRLQALAEADNQLLSATEAYQQAQNALREAEAAAADPADIDRLTRELVQQTRAYREAQRRYETLESEVLESNIEASELQRVLNAPTTPTRRGQATRDSLLAELQAAHPDRAEDLARVLETYTTYEQVKGPLEDPNDLIALLRGSGVLEFRIAAAAANVNLPYLDPSAQANLSAADAERYREQLATQGPRAGVEKPWRWFAVDDITQFINQESDWSRLEENPEAFFAQRGLIGAAYGDGYYVLLAANQPNLTMSREQQWELSSASPGYDQLGRNAVNFSLDVLGGDLMAAITGPNVGLPMAILLDNEVVSAPTLNSQISSSGQITGNFTNREREYLLRTIKAGSSEAELSEYPISIKTTGPQLGQDNLRSGVTAAVIALILVAVFMAAYYLLAGLVANVTLFANMIIILGVMAMFGATFTLPGIAGIVLTIGMAVDANVLIFERIREELERKADVATALRLGFQKALSTIVDANITTFITCVVLFYTATPEIKGFAITLMVGILATMFSALFISRVLLEMYVVYFRPTSLPMLPMVAPAVGRLLSPNVDWVGKRHLFFTISGVLMVAGLTMVVIRGQEMLDIEFRSGTQVSFRLTEGEQMPIEAVRDRLNLFAEIGDAIEEGIDPARLSPEAQAFYPIAQAVVADAQARWEQAVRQTEQDRAQGRDVDDAPDSPPDFGLLADASVVTEGETQGTLATGFSVATLIQDSRAVSDAIKAAFADVLDTTVPIDFPGLNEGIEQTDAVFPITTAAVSEVIGRPSTAQAADYVGGVAIVLENLQPAAMLSDIEERITRMRNQPAYEGLGYRPTQVIGLDAAPGEGEQWRSVVVLVRDEATNYAENPDALRATGGLAASEWQLVRDALQTDTSLASVSNFSSQVSATMQQQAIAALVLSLLAVIAYIWFRFGSIRYGVAAIIALVHDVAITLGLLAITGWFYDNDLAHFFLLNSPLKINLAIVAALLTIVGYSLNDTIIVFDRIRENRGRLAFATPQIINDSINQTISRTVITSTTTLLAVLVLYIWGGQGIHGFAFAMLMGILVGTYSSVAVASPAIMIGAQLAKRRADRQRGGSAGSATTAPQEAGA